ncbi:hypothetical protein [Noviherbaspirillum pedocola]|uniref:Uncharacterized protein n=1 Tax=Noviherbaspirillum pedocola TaxID=2801341 RepID=A0A934SYC0_9BURK|nr:hypothetical protein [Noviherbaspirillum pedocola]MBK4734939.1 hypothetical protein [Noviherbaspirillum pedocola]
MSGRHLPRYDGEAVSGAQLYPQSFSGASRPHSVAQRQPMAYSAYVIADASRMAILDSFPPKFGDVICHHVTERFGLSAGDRQLPPPAEILIVGYACDASLEALVVTVDGNMRRPDGGTYHITLSLERALGRKPVDANRVIATVGWNPVTVLRVDAVPSIC